MSEGDALHLAHIRESLVRIAAYTAAGRERFFADRMVQDAVLRNLQTLAESTQRLSPSFKAGYPDVPWRAISEFRNNLVHDYLSLDLEIIWGIVTRDLRLLDAVDEGASS